MSMLSQDNHIVVEVRKDGSRRVAMKFTGVGRTKQSFKDQCNINKIVAKYNATGMVNHLATRRAMYGDFSDIKDLASALDTVQKAEGLFNGLSADVRNRFANDPVKLMDFLAAPGNKDEAIKLGLVVPPKAAEPGAGTAPGAGGPGGPAAGK